MTIPSVNNKVIIRPAADGDFEWVANIMTRALNPFYEGDHHAHAKRIFDTHMEGGVDRVGHFSAGQHMFIAELDGQHVGIIHFVEKKQKTVKIMHFPRDYVVVNFSEQIKIRINKRCTAVS